ncbi:unnamed protein product [Soboliphyme baturini]|uniref:ABC1 domain-containing protein n=1 Tax=Soboliphyme baturini TaxID=241478 RepID=A0A183J2M2_9BILA|nr:unnamed protein product [Soboliphyme baturini]
MIKGIPVDKCVDLDQKVRNWIGKKILGLCLRELFEFHFMQTDPNWSNFFYDGSQEKIVLLDFGASRSYETRFVDKYRKILKAAYDEDREAILRHSREIGFLTGYESKVMENAHCAAVMTLGEAFRSPGFFDFGVQSTTARINQLIPVMIEHRLKPPPEEIYSLHRKLAGTFLLCSKLKSQVECSELFRPVYETHTPD